jgi:hypothetical protein
MMAIEGIGSLIQILAEQLREQTPNLQAVANTSGGGTADNVAVTEDTFVPSTQNNSGQATQQDAGLFQVSQGALSAATSRDLVAQASSTATPASNSSETAAIGTANANNAEPAAATDSNLPGTAGRLFPPSPAALGSAAKPVPTPDQQAGIQALNAALPALGLSKVEISEIDRIATQLGNFNPAAYTSLVNQFEALAHQGTQQGTPNPAASAGGSQITPGTTKAVGSGPQV